MKKISIDINEMVFKKFVQRLIYIEDTEFTINCRLNLVEEELRDVKFIVSAGTRMLMDKYLNEQYKQ